ncbi:MAG: insulinase family protein, partial [Chloroflexota bacterium]
MWKKITIIVSLLLTIHLIDAEGEVALAQAPLDFNDYKLELVDYQLSNGLRVILAEDHSAPVVAVNILYRVGGANDPQNRSGFAHLFEHMMFEGSANIGNDQYFALLEEVGASANAYTAIDKTVYYQVAPSNELPRLLWMESDRMASLGVTQEAFDTQRQVVIEEFNQRVANQPYGVSNRRLFTQPFQGYVPYERTVIGSIPDLEAATREEALAFFEQYYRPSNATLVIVGDIDVAQTQTLVQAYFGEIAAGKPQPLITQQYPLPEDFPVLRTDDTTGCQVGTEEMLIDDKVKLPRFAATVVGPVRGTPDYYALSLLSNILGRGASSRFNQNIVQAGLAARATLGLSDYLGASILATSIIPNNDGTIEDAPALLHEQFAQVRTNGVTEAELARVKEQVKISTITDFRRSVLRTAEWLQDAVLTFNDPDAIAQELAMYEAVTVGDVQRVAQIYLCDKPMNTLTTLPTGEEILADYPGLLVEPVDVDVATSATTLETVDFADLEVRVDALPVGTVLRETIPASLPVSESTFPPFELFTLENGLDVIFVEQHEVPKIRLQLFVRGSNPAVSAEKQGVASLLADLLTKGTRIRTAAQIAETIESVGGSVGARAGLESVSLSVDAPITETKLAFRLLAHLA